MALVVFSEPPLGHHSPAVSISPCFFSCAKVLAPAIRAKMLEFEAPRDLCTLAWSYSHAGVVDEALFNDLAHVLSSKVG